MALPHPVPPTLVEEPPEFEYSDGLFYVCDKRSGIYRVYLPTVFFQTIAAMAQCARQHRFRKVVPLTLVGHAASDSGKSAK
jgi:hypothetical protein